MKLIKTANKHSIKITKTEWEKIGNKQGWLKKAEDNKDNKKYEVIDNDFNRENYSDLIGKILDSPPAYAQVKVIEATSKKTIKEAKDNKKYKVIDSDFNRENYSDLIGKVFDTPPAYVQVKVIKNIQVKLIEAISK